MSSYETRQELANKIDYEGGIEEMLHYGLRDSDLPKDDIELRGSFDDMIRAWEEFDMFARRFTALLPEPGEDD